VSQAARARPLAGEFRYRHPIEIRYGDTDALGHVNNAVYLSYFEAARAGYYEQVTGHPFGTGPVAREGAFVIAEAHVVYRSPVRFGEPLACWCRVSWAGRSSFGLDYRLVAEASPIGAARTVAEGSSVQVFYDLARGTVGRMPGDLAMRMTELEGRPLPRRPAAEAHPG
jgi:acyl-CoA thioester hydrolase